jgi:hypothetical protein
MDSILIHSHMRMIGVIHSDILIKRVSHKPENISSLWFIVYVPAPRTMRLWRYD